MAKYLWRGVWVGPCMVAPLDEAARLVTVYTKQAGVADFRLTGLQGCFTGANLKSGGTHDQCAAIDITTAALNAQQEAILERAMREVGFADWNRKPSWYSAWFNKVIYGGWSSHNHGIRVGCKDHPGPSSQALGQINEYVNLNQNGLVGGDKDTGVRTYIHQTWETYLAKKNLPKPPAPKPAVPATSASNASDKVKIKAIQQALRIQVDGILGQQTYDAVWRLSMASAQGRTGFYKMSSFSRTRLQANIGCKYTDGSWIALGSEMPKRVEDAVGGVQRAMGLPITRKWVNSIEGTTFGGLMTRAGFAPKK